MMSGNPNWWSMTSNNGVHQQLVYRSSSPVSSSNPSPADDHHLHLNGQDFPVRSWSQLIMGGLDNHGERLDANIFQQQRKMENWEEQVILDNNNNNLADHAQQELFRSNYCQFYGDLDDNQEYIQSNKLYNSWPSSHHHQVIPVSSPTSCTTTLSNTNILNFSDGMKSKNQQQHNQDHSSECNSTGVGGPSKRARVTQSSAQPALKVRKEKLGDRITALHQLVSPFGKTDTASVLSEAIGYIRFLQGQIQALSTPYMRNSSETTTNYQHSVQERDCLFTNEPPSQVICALLDPSSLPKKRL